ncbi:transposase [Corynebacterium macginleyi]|nr:transposase [Corynebacterium macginleyi]MBK4158946.1 transposase [Corynebacterium macginleyi]MBK4178769.1 transposase [Corynebacterium macginleyi]
MTVGDMCDFPTPRLVASYAGLSTRTHQSGTVKSGGVVYLSFLNLWIGGQCQGRCWGPARG